MMDEASTEKMNQLGNRVIESQTGNVNSQDSRTLFSITTDNFNYLAATITPKTSEYKEGLKNGNKDMKNFMFTTLKEQMQGSEIDTSSSVETINKKSFDRFNIKINFPYKPTFHINVYSAMVRQYELGITIAYVDETVERKFTSIIQNSTFR